MWNIVFLVILIVQMMIVIYFAKLLRDFLTRFRLTNRAVEKLSLHVGDKAPLFREKNQHGDLVVMAENNKKFTLLIFVSESCYICKQLITTLPQLKKYLPYLRIIVVSGSYNKSFEGQIQDEIHYIKSDEIISNYLVNTVPSMVLVDILGDVASNNPVGTASDIIKVLRDHTRAIS